MTQSNVMQSLARANAFVLAAVLATASFLPVLLLNGSASGEQLSNRSIDMSGSQTSDGSGRDGGDAFGQDVTYTVSFELGSAHANLEGIVIDFCSDSPITGDACTAPTGFDLTGVTVGNSVGTLDPTGWTVGGTASRLILSDATGVAGSIGNSVTFDIVGITNPTTVGGFFARILTYEDSTVATAYASVTPGAFVDDGGIALSVANELTITARVQEVLEFCIGTELDSTLANIPADSCSDVAGTDLSLGVVDSNTISTTTSIDNPNDGVAMIRTNAINGAVVYYKAEQNAGSGQLKIAGSTCVGVTLDDPCFNSVGGTRAVITAGTEAFGMALKNRTTTSGGATDAVTCTTNYRGDGAAGCTGAVAGSNYAWLDDGTFASIASSGGPVDDEKVRIEFAATASPTTPTGLYTVTANFVATATF